MPRNLARLRGPLTLALATLGACATSDGVFDPDTGVLPEAATEASVDGTSDARPDGSALDGGDASVGDGSADSEARADVAMDVRPDVPCTACEAGCVDLQSDPANCGACGRSCRVLANVDPARVQCVAGACVTTNACLAGRGDCNNNALDGCEADTSTAARCGACNTTCADPTPVCTMIATDGGVGYACSSGCASPTPSRCGTTCVDLMSDARNCGGCAMACPTAPLATAACTMGHCGLQCLTGYGDCDGVTTNGCETNVRTSTVHCNACGNLCSGGPNGTPVCTAAGCGLTCAAGFGNCDGMNATGCETPTTADPMNCGACGRVCGPYTNAMGTCTASVCGLTCNAGFGNCNGSLTDGCERDLTADRLNCGACGRTCTAGANATPTCAMSTCGFTCTAGFGDCNMLGTDGCEVNVNTNVAHCGMCGRACPTGANASPSCTAGSCGLTCNAGFADCNVMASDGCETDTRTDNANCGGCGRACSAPSNATAACMGAACVVTCNTGFTLVAGTCLRTPPRPVLPDSGRFTTSRRPTLRVNLAAGQDSAEIELCNTRACTLVGTRVTTTGASGAPTVDLTPGLWFWRARGRIAGTIVTDYSTVWSFYVTAPTALPAVSASWGIFPDPNGDGVGDVLIGEPSLNRMHWRRGDSFTLSSATLTGAAGAGTAVALVGDLNGDGYVDAAMGAPSATGGTVTLYFGGVSGPTTLSQTLNAPPSVTRFGAWVSGVGDLDGDGYADLAVGAPGSNRVLYYPGSATGVNMAAPVTLAAPSGASNFGVGIATACDLDADGDGDLVIGTDGNSAVYVYPGGATGPAASPTVLMGAAGSGFGRAVDCAGDVNGDGYPDLLVGAYSSQQAMLFPGGAGGVSATPAVTLGSGLAAGSLQFGQAVSDAGDVNGDGYGDVIVGAPGSFVAYVFHGSAAGLNVASSAVLNGSSGTNWGIAVTNLGDTNRDGFSDVAVGAPTTLLRVTMYRGSATGIVTTTPTASTGSTSFGSALH